MMYVFQVTKLLQSNYLENNVGLGDLELPKEVRELGNHNYFKKYRNRKGHLPHVIDNSVSLNQCHFQSMTPYQLNESKRCGIAWGKRPKSPILYFNVHYYFHTYVYKVVYSW